jgi:hypothetical protein
MKKIIAKKEVKVIPYRIFAFKGKIYNVFKEDDATIIRCDGDIVFNSMESKIPYFKWIKSIN